MKIILKLALLCLINLACAGFANAQATETKPRVIVLTDIENEPDDTQSLIRFLVYSNNFDVEGLIATTSIHMTNSTHPEKIREVLNAYKNVRNNLLLHESGFPSFEYLDSIVKDGSKEYGIAAVGKGRDSAGSAHIINMVDKSDSRPVWILAWGGPNTLAQALWKVKNTRTKSQLKSFISKMRVYTISDQDDSGPWIRSNFPELFYIVSPGMHAGGAYHYSTWSGISGDKFHGRFTGANFEIVDNPWLDNNIRNKGPMGALYPQTKYLMEGDTPSFLNLINNGLASFENPNYGGWGGRYELYTPKTQKWFKSPETRPIWTNAIDEVIGFDGFWHTGYHETIWRWREAYQNDFAARMDWTIKPFKEANHPPIIKTNTPNIINAKPNDIINLDASLTSDIDGDTLNYKWFYYPEAGTYALSTSRSGNPLKIDNFDKAIASFKVPNSGMTKEGTMHIILAVSDNGKPSLTRYKRFIINIKQ